MIIQAKRVDGTSDADYTKQPIRLRDGMYGAVLAGYSIPKIYDSKNDKGEPVKEEAFYARFLVVADKSGHSLPQYSEARCRVRTKLFYSEKTRKASTLLNLYFALLGGTKLEASKAEIASEGWNPVDLDNLIGFPCYLFIEASTKADSNGVYANRINTGSGGFDVADTPLRELAREIKKIAEYDFIEKDGVRVKFMKSPTAEYESNDVDSLVKGDRERALATVGAAPGSGAGIVDDEFADSIPF
jgi:hypothetical protein